MRCIFFLLADLTERRLIYPHEELSSGSAAPLIYSLHCSAGYWPVIYCKWLRWYEMGENRGLIYLFIFQLIAARQTQRFKGFEGSDIRASEALRYCFVVDCFEYRDRLLECVWLLHFPATLTNIKGQWQSKIMYMIGFAIAIKCVVLYTDPQTGAVDVLCNVI